MRSTRIIGMLLWLLPCGATLATNSTVNTSNRWAWGASTGWINCRTDATNGAKIGEYVCSGYFYCPATGWISLGNGQPTNGIRYMNAATNDYGVNNEGAGNLRGYAWSDSVGWIAFESSGAPFMDMRTGIATGYAWSSTMGWIGFSNLAYFLQSDFLDTGADRDGDQIPDSWEKEKTGGTNWLSYSGDYDGDGVLDRDEYGAGTNPTNANSHLEIIGFAVTNGTNPVVSWRSESNRTYRIQQNAALTNSAGWSDSGLGLLPAGAGSESTQPLPAAETSQNFYRVKAIVPLSE